MNTIVLLIKLDGMPEDKRNLMPVGLTQSNELLKWRLFCLSKKAGQKASKEEKGPHWLKDGKEFRQFLSTKYSHQQVAKKPYTHKGYTQSTLPISFKTIYSHPYLSLQKTPHPRSKTDFNLGINRAENKVTWHRLACKQGHFKPINLLAFDDTAWNI